MSHEESEQQKEDEKYYSLECDDCDYIKKTIDYEENGFYAVRRICRICLGLGKYKKKVNKKLVPKINTKINKPNKVTFKKEIKPKEKKKAIIRHPKKNSISKEYSIGQEFNTKYENIKLKIIEKGKDNIHYWVEFQDENKGRIEACSKSIKNGTVKNPYHRNIYGVGYTGIGRYMATEKIGETYKITEAYSDWNEMLRRSYSEEMHKRRPTYKDCEVCEEWHNFQVFAEWAENTGNLYKGWHLEKDLLSNGSKLYSPETCVYLPKSINSLLRGVTSKYINKSNIKNRNLKIKEVMDEYKDELDEDIYALIMQKLDPIINYKGE